MKRNGNTPFAPSRFPFFYGWIILAAGTVGMLMSIPGQTMGVSVFTENLLTDLDVSRNNLSLAYLIGTLVSGLMIAWAGRLYDKYGARIMAFVAGILLGAMLVFLTRIDIIAELFHSRLNSFSTGMSTFILLAFGFWGIRFFGQGILTMVSRNMVMKWFDKRRGLANGIMGIFVTFGFSYAPKILDHFIDLLEWKGAWILLASVVGIAFSVFVLLIFRDNPKDSGCVADGNKMAARKSKLPPSLPERDYTLKEARLTFAFWIITLVMAINALYISGITFHVVSVFESAGIEKSTAIGIFLPASVIAIVFQFAGGWLSDYIKLKYLLSLYSCAMLITATGLIFLHAGKFAYYLIITGNGISWGMYILLAAVTWPRYFGLKHLGAISGYSLSLVVIGSALGPWLFSVSFDLLGSYRSIALFTFLISSILFVLSFRVEKPDVKNV